MCSDMAPADAFTVFALSDLPQMLCATSCEFYSVLLLQPEDPKWNESETYRFLMRYYGKAAITSTDSLSAHETIQQLYQLGRYDIAHMYDGTLKLLCCTCIRANSTADCCILKTCCQLYLSGMYSQLDQLICISAWGDNNIT